MGVVIALLIVIALILLLGPGAVWNLIVWLSIGALLLCVGVVIILLYQTHPNEVIGFSVLVGVAFLWVIVMMVTQYQRERTGVRERRWHVREPYSPSPVSPGDKH